MTKYLGAYVGTPRASTPLTPVDNAYERVHDEVIVRDLYTTAAAIVFTNTIQCCVLGWDSVLDEDGCKIHFTAGGANCTFSLGDVTYPTALDNAVSCAAAGSATLLSAVTVPNYGLPLWQLLGYATLAAALAVGRQCELLFTINTANFAAGSIYWKIVGVRRS